MKRGIRRVFPAILKLMTEVTKEKPRQVSDDLIRMGCDTPLHVPDGLVAEDRVQGCSSLSLRLIDKLELCFALGSKQDYPK